MTEGVMKDHVVLRLQDLNDTIRFDDEYMWVQETSSMADTLRATSDRGFFNLYGMKSVGEYIQVPLEKGLVVYNHLLGILRAAESTVK